MCTCMYKHMLFFTFLHVNIISVFVLIDIHVQTYFKEQKNDTT